MKERLSDSSSDDPVLTVYVISDITTADVINKQTCDAVMVLLVGMSTVDL